MVTTTTKTLNYSITKGNATNSVNATITSTPGFNSNYLGKVPGILKIVELILGIVALALVASKREEKDDLGVLHTNLTSYKREMFLVGEVYFLCAHSLAIGVLAIILIAYLFHTTSAMIIPKATTLENVANLLLALVLLAAGILEIAETVTQHGGEWVARLDGKGNRAVDDKGILLPLELLYKIGPDEFALRIAAGVIALVNGLLFIGSFVLSRKELAGPKTL